MKQIIYIITLITTLCITTSCMQNDGNIGDLYGQWRLESINHDNIIEECDTVFFAFQADVIQIRMVDYQTYVSTATTGLYTHQNNTLKLNLYYHNGYEANTDAVIEQMLNSMQAIYIDVTDPLFVVESLNSSDMTLQYDNRRYIFTKLN